ncbi:putative phloem protein [Rosa chinensis]|uniref:Putative phloem protein n=1 Tax=Rosa chinensis TaxID=74649 RepID=A0A2P6R582_ROSCH|nr:putative F-box protein PP2-B12 [Rosa chinensis]PRQ41590.1 putative phloem protein [Rosa chinensis]
MENAAVMMDLPEGCIANVIGLTTPRDACRLSLTSTDFKSAADSDAVWDKFLPPDTSEMLSRSESAIDAKSKKELFLTLSDNPILIDDGKMSFSLDKWSGKKCYMIAARRLRIAWGDTPIYWTWKSLPESRFKEAVELRLVCWLEIRGRIETRMMSPSTTYKAFLVYKLTGDTYGLHWPAVVTVGARAYGFDYECPGLKEITAGIKRTVFLAPQRVIQSELEAGRRMRPNHEISEAKFPNEGRGDGWLEMELGEFHCQGDEDGELEMICCEIETGMSKRGLLVQGIEVRPERE